MITEERLERMGCGDERIIPAELIGEIWRLRIALAVICDDKTDEHEGKNIARAALDGTMAEGLKW